MMPSPPTQMPALECTKLVDNKPRHELALELLEMMEALLDFGFYFDIKQVSIHRRTSKYQ